MSQGSRLTPPSPSHQKARQAPIPHPIVEPKRCLVINSDGAIWGIPELGVLIIQSKKVVTQRRDTWGKVKNIPERWRQIHLAICFQCMIYAKVRNSLIPKKSRSHSYPLRANTTSNLVQSHSLNHKNEELWLPRNMHYSSWQTRLKTFLNECFIIFLTAVPITESYRILL